MVSFISNNNCSILGLFLTFLHLIIIHFAQNPDLLPFVISLLHFLQKYGFLGFLGFLGFYLYLLDQMKKLKNQLDEGYKKLDIVNNKIDIEIKELEDMLEENMLEENMLENSEEEK